MKIAFLSLILLITAFSKVVLAQNSANWDQPCLHSHNDYLHRRPVYDALKWNACSLEADMFLVKGQLKIAHIRTGLIRNRSFENLYLKPLQEIVRKNNGSVYGDGKPLYLYMDLKTNANEALSTIKALLEKYRDMLTVFSPNRVETKAIIILIGGVNPDSLRSDKPSLFALEGHQNEANVPDSILWKYKMLSSHWKSDFHWNSRGEMKLEDEQRLKTYLDKANSRGLKVRFWGKPDNERLWRKQYKLGVFFMHSDKLKKMRQFLDQMKAEKGANN